MGSKIQGIIVEIGGDTTKLGNALEGINKKTKALQSELKGVNSLLKMDPTNVNLLKQKQDILNQSIGECREKLNMLKSAQAQVQAQFDKGKITQEQYRDFQREIVATETKLKSLEKEAKEFGTVGTQQIAAVGTKMEDLGDKIEGTGKKMLKVTGVVGAIGTAAIVTGANFDSSMKQVAATMGITADEINRGSEEYKILEDAAKQCGETTKYSASEAADALNYLALAGYDARKSAEVLPKVLNLAAAGNLDLATASDMVTDAMAALGMETKDLDKYIDEMAKTSQKSNTSVQQLGEATLTCAGTVKMSGMSLETMNAELGILANNGIKGAEGGTHLRNIILSLVSPTDTAATALKKLGINVLDSEGNIRDLNDIMIDFNTKLDGLSDGEKTEIISKIFNKTDISAVNALIKGSGEEFAKLKKEISDCDGTASDMADTMNSSLSGQLTLLKSQLEGIAIQIAQILMPILQKVIDVISGILNWISNLDPKVKNIIITIAGVAAVIGPLLIVIGKVISTVGTIMTFAPKIIAVLGMIKTAISGLFSIILANPVILVIGGIIAAVVLLWNKCEWFRNLVMGVFEGIKNAIIRVWENIKSVWNTVYPYFVALWEGIKSSVQPLIDAIIGAFRSAWELIKTIWDLVYPYFAAVWEKIKSIFSVVSTVLGSFFKVAWDAIKAVWDVASQYFSAIWENIKIIFSVVATVLGGFFQTAWEYIKAVWDTVVGFFAAIWDSIKGIFDAVTAVLHGDFSGAWEAIKGVVDTWALYFQGIWENIKNVFASVIDFFRNTFSAAWEGIKNIFSNVGAFFQGVWNTIKNMFTNIGTTIGNAIGDAFKTVVNAIINFAENTINKFIRAVNGAIGLINNIPGVKVPLLKELNIPRLKVGMANVPYDDYLALLHKGERVLTAKENKEYSNGDNEQVSSDHIDNSFNLTINSPTQTSPAENARLLRREIQRYRLQHE